MRMVPNPVLPNARTYAEKSARWRAHWPEITIVPWPEVSVAQDADWEALLALVLEAFAFMEGRIDPPSSAKRLTAAALAEKARRETLLLAHLGETLAGCAFVTDDGNTLCIGKLAVAPAHQGKGVGRALLSAIEAEAKNRRATHLRLQTRVELTENHATFAAMGFCRAGETAHSGYDRPTSLTMEKEIAR